MTDVSTVLIPGEPFKKGKLSKMRWLMVGMAFLATVLNYDHRLSFNRVAAKV
jgi:hypothetical protein